MTTKDLEYYINLVNKAVVSFERIYSKFERSSTITKAVASESNPCPSLHWKPIALYLNFKRKLQRERYKNFLEPTWPKIGLPKWYNWQRTCQPMQEMQVWPLGQEDQLEKEMANHSSILVWESQGQRILAGYSLWGCRRIGHNLVTKQQQALILQILTDIIKVWCFPYKWFGFFAWIPRQVCVFIFFLLFFCLCVFLIVLLECLDVGHLGQSSKPCGKPPFLLPKFPEVLLTQLPFFNLYSFGALSFNQIWSNQPWKSHWKIFNWIMLISISFISQWPWRLEICVITSIVLLFSECVSTCMHCWIKDLS